MQTHATNREAVIKQVRGEIERKTGKTLEQLYEERERRVTDVVQLKVPDRMPVFLNLGNFPAKYAGLPRSTPFYDPAGYWNALVKALADFEPDIFSTSNLLFSGIALEKVGTRQYLWPGGPLPPQDNPQFREMEMMKEDEYDLFITDPTDFVLRYFVPRRFAALEEAFSKLPPLGHNMYSQSVPGFLRMSPIFAEGVFQKAAKALFEAGEEQSKFVEWREDVGRELGFPPLNYPGGNVVTPFDLLGDALRGMSGIAIDMFKQPEKLHLAMERILEWKAARAVPPDPKNTRRRVYGAGAHWGSEAFLSKKQFETFYWPTWKKSLLAAIDMGFTPVLHPEGKSDDRIECFLELPKGKALLHNEILDVFKAKEILGGHISFMGGVPAGILHFGSTQEIDEYCKRLIKICGKDGGYILSAAAVGEDDAKPANLKAMVDSVKKYGRYD